MIIRCISPRHSFPGPGPTIKILSKEPVMTAIPSLMLIFLHILCTELRE